MGFVFKGDIVGKPKDIAQNGICTGFRLRIRSVAVPNGENVFLIPNRNDNAANAIFPRKLSANESQKQIFPVPTGPAFLQAEAPFATFGVVHIFPNRFDVRAEKLVVARPRQVARSHKMSIGSPKALNGGNSAHFFDGFEIVFSFRSALYSPVEPERPGFGQFVLPFFAIFNSFEIFERQTLLFI